MSQPTDRSPVTPRRWTYPFLALFALIALAIAAVWLPASEARADEAPVTVYRLYNQWSHEHLFTTSEDEYEINGANGWQKEGVAWKSPSHSSTPVYRLYNPWSGDHHYTTSLDEYESSGSQGWEKEDVAWYSDDAKGMPVYRLYNPYEETGTHHYTTSLDEYNASGLNGWVQEEVGWYGLAEGWQPGKPDQPDQPEEPEEPSSGAETIENVASDIDDVVQSPWFDSLSDSQKMETALQAVAELNASGAVESYASDPESGVISYETKEGIKGYVLVKGFTDDFNDNSQELVGDLEVFSSLSEQAADSDVASLQSLEQNRTLLIKAAENDDFRDRYLSQITDNLRSRNCYVDSIDEVTPDKFLNALENAEEDFIFINAHGFEDPLVLPADRETYIALDGRMTIGLNERYYDDLVKGTLCTINSTNFNKHTYMFKPQFLEDHLSQNALEDKLVYLGACMGCGCDCRAHGVEYGFLTAMRNHGAGAAIGMHNSVTSAYNYKFVNSILLGLLDGKGLSEAVHTAKVVVGENDGIEEYENGHLKRKAFPVVDPDDSTFNPFIVDAEPEPGPSGEQQVLESLSGWWQSLGGPGRYVTHFKNGNAYLYSYRGSDGYVGFIGKSGVQLTRISSIPGNEGVGGYWVTLDPDPQTSYLYSDTDHDNLACYFGENLSHYSGSGSFHRLANPLQEFLDAANQYE